MASSSRSPPASLLHYESRHRAHKIMTNEGLYCALIVILVGCVKLNLLSTIDVAFCYVIGTLKHCEPLITQKLTQTWMGSLTTHLSKTCSIVSFFPSRLVGMVRLRLALACCNCRAMET